MPCVRSKLRISHLQILEGLTHAVMIGHQWMSPLEHTSVLSGPLWEGEATPQMFVYFPRVVGK